MDYKGEIQDILEEFEKKFNLNLENLNWVESRLSSAYGRGQYSRSEKDYDSGYDDGYKEGKQEARWNKDGDGD